MKTVRTVLNFFAYSIVGISAAFFTGYVAVREQVDEIATIGVKTYYGFPLQHVMNAPGLSRSEWDLASFLANATIFGVVCWFIISRIYIVYKKQY